MLLDVDKIKEIATGVEEVECLDGEVIFRRFTRQEIETYELYDRDPRFAPKVYTTSGVRLDFETDADEVVLSGRVMSGCSARVYFYFDVYVNGTIREHFGEEQALSGVPYFEFSYRAQLGEGNKSVSIYFPFTSQARIREVELSGASYVRPQKKREVMLAYGDSITQGFDASYPSLTYASVISRVLSLEIINKAVGGERFFPQLLRTDDVSEPKYILVAYGSNDWAKSEREEFEVDCAEFFEELVRKYPQKQIFVLTPIWRGNAWHTQKCSTYESVGEYIKQVCSRYPNIRVVDGQRISANNKYFYYDKYLHPNDMGAMVIGHALSDIIKEYI